MLTIAVIAAFVTAASVVLERASYADAVTTIRLQRARYEAART